MAVASLHHLNQAIDKFGSMWPKIEVLYLIRLFWGWVSPYIGLTYTLYRWVPSPNPPQKSREKSPKSPLISKEHPIHRQHQDTSAKFEEVISSIFPGLNSWLWYYGCMRYVFFLKKVCVCVLKVEIKKQLVEFFKALRKKRRGCLVNVLIFVVLKIRVKGPRRTALSVTILFLILTRWGLWRR